MWDSVYVFPKYVGTKGKYAHIWLQDIKCYRNFFTGAFNTQQTQEVSLQGQNVTIPTFEEQPVCRQNIRQKIFDKKVSVSHLPQELRSAIFVTAPPSFASRRKKLQM